MHLHSGAAPMEDYGEHVGMMGIYITEVVWWSVRPLWFLIWGGVFERHPRLKLAITESTTIWVPEALALMDQRYSETHYSAKLGDYRSHLSMKPSEYFHRNVFLGASCMPRREVEMRARDRARKHHVGLGLPASRGHLARDAAADARDLPRRSRSRSSPRCSAATPRASTASTRASSRRWSRASAPRRRAFRA